MPGPWYRMEASRRECKGLDVPWRSCSYHQQIWAGRECGRLAQSVKRWSQSIDRFDVLETRQLTEGTKGIKVCEAIKVDVEYHTSTICV